MHVSSISLFPAQNTLLLVLESCFPLIIFHWNYPLTHVRNCRCYNSKCQVYVLCTTTFARLLARSLRLEWLKLRSFLSDCRQYENVTGWSVSRWFVLLRRAISIFTTRLLNQTLWRIENNEKPVFFILISMLPNLCI